MRLRYVIFLGTFWLLYKMFNHSAWFHINTLIFWWSSFITWIYIKRQPSHCRSIRNCTPLWTRTPASQIIILKFCQPLFKKSRIPGKPTTRHGAQHILTIISWCQCTIAPSSSPCKRQHLRESIVLGMISETRRSTNQYRSMSNHKPLHDFLYANPVTKSPFARTMNNSVIDRICVVLQTFHTIFQPKIWSHQLSNKRGKVWQRRHKLFGHQRAA